ncbi:hypothetical protein Dsin_016489 [Dipteronia sinensis]|uniref:Zinc finger PMZ-type domain-containing protein n=1 Tax=Dipteronia sinensis TaxID=43782 RepID=A0AAE0AE60_9ROSI|nr:hypothetical protein Dsin_016489 [Dipteronia sinensis]
MRHQLTDATHLVILKHVEKCGCMSVNPFDWNIFSVKRSRKQWTVDLARKTCTYNKFQMDHFSCSHALTSARYIKSLESYAILTKSDRQTFIDTYSVPITPVVPSDIDERVVLNLKSKRQSGHPIEGRHASSSERTTTQSCKRCGQSVERLPIRQYVLHQSQSMGTTVTPAMYHMNNHYN